MITTVQDLIDALKDYDSGMPLEHKVSLSVEPRGGLFGTVNVLCIYEEMEK